MIAKRPSDFEHQTFLTEIQIVRVPTERLLGEQLRPARCHTRPCGTQDSGFGVQSAAWRNQPEEFRSRAAHGPAVGLADSELRNGCRREHLPEGTRRVVRIPIEVVYQGRGLFGTVRGASSRGEAAGAAWPTATPRSPCRSPVHGSRAERASAWDCSLPRPKPMSQRYDLRADPQAATAGIFNGRLTPRGSSHLYLRNSRDPLSHSARRPSSHPRMDSLETPARASVPQRGRRSPMTTGWFSPIPRRTVDTTADPQFGSDERTGRRPPRR